MILPGLRQTLHSAFLFVNSSTSTPNNLDQCVQLIEHYLCLYYFPLCRSEDGKILKVCSSTCNLLFNNENCSNLFMNALNYIGEQNITLLPDSDSCATTFRPFVESDQPSVSQKCASIEGQNLEN